MMRVYLPTLALMVLLGATHRPPALHAQTYVVSDEVSVCFSDTNTSNIVISPEVTISFSTDNNSNIIVSAEVTVDFSDTNNSNVIASAEVTVVFCRPGPDDDCNANGVSDQCELVTGDLDLNGILDECEGPPPQFIRGDANLDGDVNLADVPFIIAYLFQSGPADCRDALDADDSESVSLADAFLVLCHLFGCGGPATLPNPFPDCGVDSTAGGLPCSSGGPGCP